MPRGSTAMSLGVLSSVGAGFPTVGPLRINSEFPFDCGSRHWNRWRGMDGKLHEHMVGDWLRKERSNESNAHAPFGDPLCSEMSLKGEQH